MYYDVFFNTANVTVIDDPLQEVEGRILDFPGPKQAVVYALVNVMPLPGAGESPIGVYHCLVTEEQLDQLEADNIPMVPPSAVNNLFYNEHGGPGHVFNPEGIVFRENGKKWIHRIKSNAPEEIVDEVIE